MATNLNRAWALLFARLILGFIFFMAGVMKIFQLGPLEHARKYFLPFSDTFLPTWSLWAVGVAIPFIELIGGALVILGLRTRDALIAQIGAGRICLAQLHRPEDALRFYEAAGASAIPHLDWEQTIASGIRSAKAAMPGAQAATVR